MNTAPLTPMLRQYLEIKERYRDAILFFRLGDFYEMFFEDAELASQVLEIALTSRNKNQENAVPLCGVPYHSATTYIARLIQAGYKVALCEQVEDPKLAKGIVKREVVRIITPGLTFETDALESKENNFVAAVSFGKDGVGLALSDATTGETLLNFFSDPESCFAELLRRDPKELLVVAESMQHPALLKFKQLLPKTLFQGYALSQKEERILEKFPSTFQESWRQLALVSVCPAAHQAALLLFDYICETVKTPPHHFQTLSWMFGNPHVILDSATVRNLELIRNLSDGKTWGTLLDVLDHTETAMGARLLKQWILYPLVKPEAIAARQEVIGQLLTRGDLLTVLREYLSKIVDLERLNARVSTGVAHARDLLALGSTLEVVPAIAGLLRRILEESFRENLPDLPIQPNGLLDRLLFDWPDLKSITQTILNTLKEDAPLTLREGGLVASGIHPELDELREIQRDAKAVLAKFEEEERRTTGIQTLKVRYNRVFGYYIEISNARKDAVPAHYIRKQTLANAERYLTPELKVFEEKVLSAEERIRHLEYELFLQLKERVLESSAAIGLVATKIAQVDCLASLASSALENNYSRPQFIAGEELLIEEGRHPVLEKLFPASKFIPNDTELDTENHRLILLTGPNMAGKSTFLRQVALIALMAHMGSYVPAKSVRLGLVDRIFTRIGASDNLSKNQSTFWIEMAETAHILKSATQKSLIVLDEIGRGTSTYDGLSLAWAIAEHLHDTLQSKTIFATHYHELIALAEQRFGICNFHVAVKEFNGEIIFLHKIVSGGVSQSYGLQVAHLAGIPQAVVLRAKAVLQNLQKEPHAPPVPAAMHPPEQLSLFTPPTHPILEKLKQIDLTQLTPMQALQVLADWQEKMRLLG